MLRRLDDDEGGVYILQLWRCGSGGTGRIMGGLDGLKRRDLSGRQVKGKEVEEREKLS